MKTVIELLKNHEGQFTSIVMLLFALKYLIKHRAVLQNFLQSDIDSKLADLRKDLLIAKKNKSGKTTKKIIKAEIRFWEFAKLTGYRWNSRIAKVFMSVYEMTGEDITLKWVKLLFVNSKIDNGIFEVKISNMTKFDFIGRYAFACLKFLLLPFFGIMFFMAVDNIEFKLLFYLFFGIALITGVHNVRTANRERTFLNRMKMQYNGTKIG